MRFSLTAGQKGDAPEAGPLIQDLPAKIVMADTDGWLLMVHLTAADLSDSAGGQVILDGIRKRWPWVKHLFADGAYDRLRLMNKVPISTSSWRSSGAQTTRRVSRSCRADGSWSAPSAG